MEKSLIRKWLKALTIKGILNEMDQNDASDKADDFEEGITYEGLLLGGSHTVKGKFKGTIFELDIAKDKSGRFVVGFDGDFNRIVILTYKSSYMQPDFRVGNNIFFYSKYIELIDYRTTTGELVKVPLIEAFHIETI